LAVGGKKGVNVFRLTGIAVQICQVWASIPPHWNALYLAEQFTTLANICIQHNKCNAFLDICSGEAVGGGFKYKLVLGGSLGPGWFVGLSSWCSG
jgi:hypothetical protein